LEYVDIVQEIANKGAYVNAKCENAIMSFHLACKNNYD
jgi:hypothetical protein